VNLGGLLELKGTRAAIPRLASKCSELRLQSYRGAGLQLGVGRVVNVRRKESVCQLGDLESVKKFLTRAFEIDPNWRFIALDDVDLEPLCKMLAAIYRNPSSFEY
jgi:hypothetical protein